VLKLRIFTAVFLLGVLLPALAYPAPEPFLFLTLVFIAGCAWEWGRLNAQHTLRAAIGSLMVAAFGLSGWYLEFFQGLEPFVALTVWAPVVFAWCLAAVVFLLRGPAFWIQLSSLSRWGLGLMFLLLSWVALAQAYTVGVNFLLSVCALIWVSDICAYVFGQVLGGFWVTRKLAPVISPGKCWEGVLGSLLGVGVLSAVWILADRHLWPALGPSLFTVLFSHGLLETAAGVLALTLMGIAGDLLESLFKRGAGVKDSGHLLPGHGGFLDRADALLPALPLGMLIYAWCHG
jgi:phosphatidate cytidylyltransferase